MKYSDGQIELSDDEAKMLESFLEHKVERNYPASSFLGEIQEIRQEALKNIAEFRLQEGTERTKLLVEVVELLVQSFDILLERFAEVTRDAEKQSILN